jgi:RNA 3'-terminal phosphate cyclase (ATP)
MDILTLDGSDGEGGGQILRTALSLSTITARAFRMVNIRSNRRKPGLMPQHLCAVRAAAAISGAVLAGDYLGSTELEFAPAHVPWSGDYVFDVAETAELGSAGSVSLILQTLLVPLAFADKACSLTLRGGTHVEWSPSFDFLANAYFPALRHMGFCFDALLKRWGWYPAGGGELVCRIAPRADSFCGRARPAPIEVVAPGTLRRIAGRAVAANLPSHIPQRMADRACALLASLHVPIDIEQQLVTATSPGAGIFIAAEYEQLNASFSGLGRRGKPAELVAEEAVAALLDHHASGAAVELHLADQLLLPLALASGTSTFTAARPTRHFLTNAWTIGEFGLAEIVIEQEAYCRVRVTPTSGSRNGPRVNPGEASGDV